jgi:hypothetical protein
MNEHKCPRSYTQIVTASNTASSFKLQVIKRIFHVLIRFSWNHQQLTPRTSLPQTFI